MNLDNLVLSRPYEDALCLFCQKTLDPDYYEWVRINSNSYYRYIVSGKNDTTLERAIDYAILFDKIHVHPIDLRIYENQNVLILSNHRDPTESAFISEVNRSDKNDSQLQAILKKFGQNGHLLQSRLNWHLYDANYFNAPIAASDKVMELYKYKLNRAAVPIERRSAASLAKKLDTIVNDEVGVSFKIKDWDRLVEVRKDPDLIRYRKKLCEYIDLVGRGESEEDIREDVRDALANLRTMDCYKSASRVATFASPLLMVSDVLTGSPLASVISTLSSITLELRTKQLESKHKWIRFKTTPVRTKTYSK